MNERKPMQSGGRARAGGHRPDERPPAGPRAERLEPRILLSSGPTVVSFDPEGTTADAFQDVVLHFSAPVAPEDARDAETYLLTHLGGDGALGGGDDYRVPVLPRYLDTATQVRLSPAADVSEWDEADYFLDLGLLGEWDVAAGGASARQQLDGGATFLVSAEDTIDETFSGTLRVDDATDDDFVGFVFGFRADPQTGRPDRYYLLSWKAEAQGPAEKGIKLVKVTGTGPSGQTPDLWDLDDSDPRLAVLAADTTVGWEASVPYEFSVDHASDGSLDVVIRRGDDGTALWQYQGTDPDPLGAGKVGFYNLSQAGATYAARTASIGWADGAYRLEAASGDPGLRGLDGAALDGDDDGAAGGDYVQTFGVEAQVAQMSIRLAADSDTGLSDSDGVTNVNPPVFEVIVNEAGVLAVDYQGDEAPDLQRLLPGAGTYEITFPTLADGQYTVAAELIPVSGQPATDSFALTIDTTAPALLPGRPVAAAPLAQRVLTFSKAIDPGTLTAADVVVSGPGIEAGPVAGVTGATDTFTATFDPLLTRNAFTLTVAATVADLAGNPLSQEGIDAFQVLVDPAWLDTDTVLGLSDIYDGRDLVVDGATVTIDGAHAYNSLWLIGGGVVTHSPSDAAGLSLTIADSALIEAGSSISADGKGADPAGVGGSGEGGGGGGHGGAGGAGAGTSGGAVHGALLEPTDLGSPGGIDPLRPGDGGAGGGAIRLIVAGTLTLDGQITADGAVGGNPDAGGGSGGSLWVTAGTLTGGGLFRADGAGGAGSGGGGGGGRIAVYATARDGFDEAHASAQGGAGHGEGQPGTIHWGTLDPGAIALDLHPDSDTGLSPTDGLTRDNTPTLRVTVLQAGQLTVDFDGDGTPEIDEQVAPALYEYTAPFALEDGPGTIAATLTVPQLGSVARELAIEVDTVAPSLETGPATESAPVRTRALQFSEEIDPATLTLADLALTGPGGPLAGALASLEGAGAGYVVHFSLDDPFNDAGQMVLDLGSRVADPAGNVADLPLEDTFLLLPDGLPPAVIGLSPVGPVAADVGQVLVEFDEEIREGTFTSQDVGVVGPGGSLDPADLAVTQTGAANFEVLFPAQTAEGVYEVTIGPAVADLVGNEMPVAHQGTFTIDKTGLRVESIAPSGPVAATVGAVDVIFDGIVDRASFAPGDVVLTGPEGQVPVLDVRRITGVQYRLSFAAQRANGEYTVEIGPTVLDLAGNAMNQDGDGVNGEPDADAFGGSFTIALPDLAVADGAPGDVPPAANQGEAIPVRWTIRNDGDSPAAGEWTERIWLSADALLDVQADILLGEQSAGVSELAPGGSYLAEANVALPEDLSLPDGTYYVLVEADAGQAVVESVEGNNVTAIGSLEMTLPPLPDLAVRDVAGPATAMPGETIEVTWTLANDDLFEADGSWAERIYLSDDAAVGGDRLVAVATYTGTLGGGQSTPRAHTITVPTDVSGPVWLVVDTNPDGELFERSLDNNGDVAATPTTVPAVLALIVSADQVLENAANPAIHGVVTRTGPVTEPLEVDLDSSDTSELTVPASVTIPAGHYATTFDAEVRADGEVDGTQTVVVSAGAAGFLGDEAQIDVLDADRPTLALALDPAGIEEGETLTATVTRSLVSDMPLTVSVGADIVELGGCACQGTQIELPASVVIPADQASATFEITVVDDELVEICQTHVITVTAGGYVEASESLAVTDNDVPQLTLTFDAEAIREGAANPAAVGTITRSIVSGLEQPVVLSSSDGTEAIVPARVVIPAGEASDRFDILAVDDAEMDGTQTVVIEAMLTCFLNLAIDLGGTQASLDVLDDDGPTLTVTIDRDVAAEGIVGAATVTVTRNTDTADPLDVTIESGDPDELYAPAAVTIPAGKASVSFGVDTVEDGEPDGNQAVDVTARAEGFTSGSDTLVVTDVDLPDLLITGVDVPAAAVATESYFDVTYRMENLGPTAAEGQWTQQVWLSDDALVGEDELVGTYEFGGTIPPDLFFQRTVPVRAPLEAGTYYVFVTTDAGGDVDEVLETNNTSRSGPVTVEAAYSATVSAAVDQALAGTPVQLTGQAIAADTQLPAPYVMVTLYIGVRGTTRRIAAFTNEAGEFTAMFWPLPGEAGHYTVGAAHPGDGAAPVQDEFDLLGMHAGPSEAWHTLVEGGGGAAGRITIENLADVPLTGLEAHAVDAPDNLDVTVSLDGATVLGGLATLPLDYEIHATDASVPYPDFTIRVTSDQGASVDVPVHVLVKAQAPVLVADPGSLSAAMLRGGQTVVEFQVTNDGGAETGPLTVLLPELSWLDTATPQPMPSIAPGESASVTLLLTPAQDAPLETYEGQIVLSAAGAQRAVPFQFRTISDAVGDLRVRATDEYTFFAEGQPPVVGATVRLVDPDTGAVLFEGVTGADGTVLLSDVPEAWYRLEVYADEHNPVQTSVRIEPGAATEVEVFLPRQGVTYEWSVVPVEQTDEYRLTVEALFETNVPMPVVTFDEQIMVPYVLPGQTTQMEMTLTNHGLIAAQNVEISVAGTSQYELIPLVTHLGTLPAKSSVTIPVLIRAIDQPVPLAGSAEGSSGDLPPWCEPSPKVEADYGYICAEQEVRRGAGVDVQPFLDAYGIYQCLKSVLGAGVDAAMGNLLGAGLGVIDAICNCIPPQQMNEYLRCFCQFLSALTGGIPGLDYDPGELLRCVCPRGVPAASGPGGPGVLPSVSAEGGRGGSITICGVPIGGQAAAAENVQALSDGVGVCAQVRIRIDQEAVMTRSAFQATLDLINQDAVALEDIWLVLRVEDGAGNDVTGLFGIDQPALTGLDAVDGTGGLAPSKTGRAQFTILPTTDAATDGPEWYFVGGELRYTVGGTELSVNLLPVEIQVLPQAELDVVYFHQRDVFSDDPFTDEVEPAQPYQLAVLVANRGGGTASDLTITSAQPKIIENEKGLLIEFQIIATEVAGQSMTPSLTADFGDIGPGEIEIARWWLTSTLQGQFLEYDATFEHVDGLGDPRLSLIQSVAIHELIQSVRAYGPFEDGKPDFLVNDVPDPDDLPDTLYLSDGSVAFVGLAAGASADGPAGPGDLEVALTVEMASGWGYLRMPDPGGEDYRLVGVRRGDGTLLPVENFWQTDRTFIEGGQRPIEENVLHLLDYDGTGTYALTYVPRDLTGPAIVDMEQPGPGLLNEPVAAVELTFSEEIDPAGFDRADVTLTRDGGANLVDAGVTVEHVAGATYRVAGLAGLTAEDGAYTLTVDPAGVTDRFGNAGAGARSVSWAKAAAAPGIEALSPVPAAFRNEPLATISVTFSEPLNPATFTESDLSLTRDGGDVPLAGLTVSQTGESTYLVGDLEGPTAAEGTYVLTVRAAGVEDPDGNAGVGERSVSWVMDTTAPTVQSLAGPDDPTNAAVATVEVELSEPAAADTFDAADLALTRDGGGENLIGPDVRVQHVSGGTYRIAGLAASTGADGRYTLTLDAAGWTDRAGNAGAGTAAVAWTMDTVPPAAPTNLAVNPDTGAAGDDGVTNASAVTILGDLAEPGLHVAVFDETSGLALGAADVAGMTFDLSAGLAPGAHTLRITASDAAGNEADAWLEVFVDTTAPLVRDVTPVPGGIGTAPVPALYVTFSEEIDPATFGASDLSLTRDGGENLVGAGVSVLPAGGSTWRIEGLAALTDRTGAYELTIDTTGVADLAGNAGADPHVVTWVLDLDPPVVESFTRNDGRDVWSKLSSAAFTFSEDVTVAATALRLVSRTTGTEVDLGASPDFLYDAPTRTARWGLPDESLPYGDYLLVLDAAAVSDAAGHALDGNGDGVGGDDRRLSALKTFPGDADLDGDVDVEDANIVATHLGILTGMTWGQGDFDADGAVTWTDYLAMKAHSGEVLRLDRLTVSFAEMNDGAGRHHKADAIAFAFSEAATVVAGALSLHNDSLGQPVAPPAAGAFLYDAENDTARWDLVALELTPGHYTATLAAGEVVDEQGAPLDGDEDGTAGGDYHYAFLVTQPGDADLDGTVGFLDYLTLKSNLGTASGGTWATGDFNGDRAVNGEDLDEMKEGFGQSVDVPVPEAGSADSLAAPALEAEPQEAVGPAGEQSDPAPAAEADLIGVACLTPSRAGRRQAPLGPAASPDAGLADVPVDVLAWPAGVPEDQGTPSPSVRTVPSNEAPAPQGPAETPGAVEDVLKSLRPLDLSPLGPSV